MAAIRYRLQSITPVGDEGYSVIVRRAGPKGERLFSLSLQRPNGQEFNMATVNEIGFPAAYTAQLTAYHHEGAR